MKMHRRFIT